MYERRTSSINNSINNSTTYMLYMYRNSIKIPYMYVWVHIRTHNLKANSSSKRIILAVTCHTGMDTYKSESHQTFN